MSIEIDNAGKVFFPGAGFTRADLAAYYERTAGQLADEHPDDFTTAHRKDKRRGRLYLDIRRNTYAQTGISPYSLRETGRADCHIAGLGRTRRFRDWPETISSGQHLPPSRPARMPQEAYRSASPEPGESGPPARQRLTAGAATDPYRARGFLA